MVEMTTCPSCHHWVPKGVDICPNCGASLTPEWTPWEEAISPEVYSGSVVASGLMRGASVALRGTIDAFQRLPVEEQERRGITDVVPPLNEIKGEIDTLNLRLTQVEENIADRDSNFVKFKEDLYIPDEVLNILPTEVRNIIVDTVQKCFERGIPQACPPFMRKALAAAITIRFRRENKEDRLYNANRKPFGLLKMIELAKQERYLSPYLARQLGQVKFFGDIAAHDYKVILKEQDIIPDFRILRTALEHMYRNMEES